MNSKMDRLAESLEFHDGGPGSILKDFQTLLDFVGYDGLKASGKHNFLPLSCLSELDARLTYPTRPAKQRPQQRSYPAIHGLYLLLRTTALGVLEGESGKSQLCVDSEVLELWRQLNPTEQYFHLLEAWLVHGTYEIWGEHAGRWAAPFLVDVSQLVSSYLVGRRRASEDDFDRLRPHDRAHLALLEMFALAELKRKNPRGQVSWQITSAQLTDFGSAIMDVIHEIILTAEILGDGREANKFGVLQPYLQPHFSAWQNNLVIPDAGFREGVYHLKVSLGDTWRRIAIPASCDLKDLAYAILDSYDFDDDHLYCFTLHDRRGREISVEHPECDADHFVDEIPIGAAPIRVGETIPFVYDFGDEWQFAVKLESIEAPNPRIKQPQLIEACGKSPPQYDWDDAEDEGEAD